MCWYAKTVMIVLWQICTQYPQPSVLIIPLDSGLLLAVAVYELLKLSGYRAFAADSFEQPIESTKVRTHASGDMFMCMEKLCRHCCRGVWLR